MNDFKVMAGILSAIRQCEYERRMDLSLFDARALKTDESTRDSLIVKLQEDGYVEGFCIIDDIDNQEYPVVLLNKSIPKITIKGMTFIEGNKPLKEAIRTMKDVAIAVATAKLTNGLFIFSELEEGGSELQRLYARISKEPNIYLLNQL